MIATEWGVAVDLTREEPGVRSLVSFGVEHEQLRSLVCVLQLTSEDGFVGLEKVHKENGPV